MRIYEKIGSEENFFEENEMIFVFVCVDKKWRGYNNVPACHIHYREIEANNMPEAYERMRRLAKEGGLAIVSGRAKKFKLSGTKQYNTDENGRD